MTALPCSFIERLGVKVKPTNRTLKAAGNQRLTVNGTASVVLKYKNKQVRETIFLVNGLVTPLLGKPAISKLDIIEFTDSVETTCWSDKYPKLFTGLGSMKSEVKISIRDGYCEII